MLKVVDHAGSCLVEFLDFGDRRNLAATSKEMAKASEAYETEFGIPLLTGQRWRTLVNRFDRLQRLRVFPNALQELAAYARVERLVAMDLSFCGLSYANVRGLGMKTAMCRAKSLKHLTLSNNPDLMSEGLRCILKYLSKGGATLDFLAAADAGIKCVAATAAVPALRCLKELVLTKNPLRPASVASIARAMPRLLRLSVDIGVFVEARVACPSLWRLTTHTTTKSATLYLEMAGVERLGLVCNGPGPLVCRRVGPRLKRLSIGGVAMDESRWTVFLRGLASLASLRVLELTRVGGLSVQALEAFIECHREPTVFSAFGLHFLPHFTELDLIKLCKAIRKRGMRIQKWALASCRRLRFRESAPDFLETIDTSSQSVHLDISTSVSLSLGRKRDEAGWLEEVLGSPVKWSYLGLGGRYAIVELGERALRAVKTLHLESTEINWGVAAARQLKVLSLYNVQSRYHSHGQLLSQALRLPKLSHLRVDYCHLDGTVVVPTSKYLSSLEMNWCVVDSDFRSAFLRALNDGNLPSLTTLGILNAPPSFVCLVVLALGSGRRNCEVDARGRLWNANRLRFLTIALRKNTVGTLRSLRLSVESNTPAQSQLRDLKRAFPWLLLQ